MEQAMHEAIVIAVEREFPGTSHVTYTGPQRGAAIAKARARRRKEGAMIDPDEELFVLAPAEGDEIEAVVRRQQIIRVLAAEAGFGAISWSTDPADVVLARGLVLALGDQFPRLFRTVATTVDLDPATWGDLFLWNGQQVVMAFPDAQTIKARGRSMTVRARGWLEKLRLVYKGELNPLWDIGMKCVVCTRHSVEFDGQGFGWCSEHEIEVKARYAQPRVRVTNSGVIETMHSMFKEEA